MSKVWRMCGKAPGLGDLKHFRLNMATDIDSHGGFKWVAGGVCIRLMAAARTFKLKTVLYGVTLPWLIQASVQAQRCIAGQLLADVCWDVPYQQQVFKKEGAQRGDQPICIHRELDGATPGL